VPPESAEDPRVGDLAIPNERRDRWNGVPWIGHSRGELHPGGHFPSGRAADGFPIETNGEALVEAISRTPGGKVLVVQEGIQSAWVQETLCPHLDAVVVARVTECRGR